MICDGFRDGPVGRDRLCPPRQVYKGIDSRIDDRDQGLHDLILTAPGDPGVELNVFRHVILVRQIQFLRLLTQPL